MPRHGRKPGERDWDEFERDQRNEQYRELEKMLHKEWRERQNDDATTDESEADSGPAEVDE
jgi:hypothetical protein